ncbi:MAG: PAS domain S-box protein [Candidatus Sericytochromatia bacterium]
MMHLYSRIFAELPNGAAIYKMVYDAQGLPSDYLTLDVNAQYELLIGISRGEHLRQSASQRLSPADLKHWLDVFAPVAAGGPPAHYENYFAQEHKYFSGSAFYLEPGLFMVMFTDITAQKQAEEALQELLQFEALLTRIYALLANAPTEELEQAIKNAQREICELLKIDVSALSIPLDAPHEFKVAYLYQVKDLPPPPPRINAEDLYPWTEKNLKLGQRIVLSSLREAPAEAAQDIETWQGYGLKSVLLFPLLNRDGQLMGTLSFYMIRQERVWPPEIINHLQLVTQTFANALTRKREEETLERKKSQLSALIYTLPDLVWLKDPQGVYLRCNSRFEALYGSSEAEIIGKTDRDFVSEELASFFRKHDVAAIETGRSLINQEWLTFARDGYRGLFETIKTPMYDANQHLVGVLGIARDITELKQTELRLARLNRVYAVLSAVNEAIVHLRSPQALFEKTCQIAIQHGGFRLAWIGQATPEGDHILPICQAGVSEGYVENLHLTLQHETGPTSRAMLSGAHWICEDILHDPIMSPWREAALQRGYRASGSFPILVSGQVQGSLNLYAEETDFFDEELVALFLQLCQDLGFALEFMAQEKQTREETEFRQKLIDSVAGIFFAIEPTGQLVLWNHPLEELTGHPPKALKTKTLDSCFTQAKALQTCIHRILTTGQEQIEVELKHKSGKKTPYLLTLKRIQQQGKTLIAGTGTDISERVQLTRKLEHYSQNLEKLVSERTQALQISERRFRRLIEGVQKEYFFYTATQGCVLTYLSPSAEELVGRPLEEMLHHPLYEVLNIDPEEWQKFGQKVKDLPTGEVVPPTELTAHLQGQVKYLEITGNLILGPHGEAQEGEGVIKNITRQKRIEAELREAKDKAEKASQAKSMFLANMSHEIRTPLNAILGFSELLQEHIRDPHYHDFLAAIASSGHTLLNIINDILDLSKIEAGKIDIHTDHVDLRALIKEIEILMRYSFEKKGLYFQIQIDSALPEALWLDPLRLRQILLNLLSNALKFTQEGQVGLSVHYVSQSDTTGSLKISVRDTGPGISEEFQQRIFGAFEQAQVGNQHRGGTGLGLSISKHLAELMRGSLELESRPGQGSCFNLNLPVVISTRTACETHKSEQEGAFAFLPARLLIADDRPENSLLLQAYLSAAPFDIETAQNGQAAYELALRQKPDLILMDIKMPVLDGFGALKKLRDNPITQAIPAIALTAYSLQEDQHLLLNAGFDAYLRKPLTKQALEKCLRQFLPFQAREADPHLKQPATTLSQSAQSQLQALLQNHWLPYWQKIQGSIVVNELETFAVELKLLSQNYALNELSDYAETLLSQIQAFALEQTQTTLQAFPALVKNLNQT